jgi:pimeloyl-ACP methyl ester carboxylesterase
VCAEDFPFIDLDADYSDTLIGNLMIQGMEAQCSAWNSGTAPEGFHDPVVSDLPVLLMAGERDPVTPPQYARQAAETFSNSQVLIARGQSHSVMKLICLQEVTRKFIELGSVDELDTACVDKIQPSPFFTSLLGPDP